MPSVCVYTAHMSATTTSDPKVRIPRKLYDELVEESRVKPFLSVTAYVVHILEARKAKP